MGPTTVLLVDADEDSRVICGSALRHYGYEVLAAPDAAQGLRMAHAHHPAVILTEVTLPLLDGWELVRRLRQDPRTGSIPVVILTARATAAERERARRAGAGWLTKPCPPRLVLQEVARLVGVPAVAHAPTV